MMVLCIFFFFFFLTFHAKNLSVITCKYINCYVTEFVIFSTPNSFDLFFLYIVPFTFRILFVFTRYYVLIFRKRSMEFFSASNVE